VQRSGLFLDVERQPAALGLRKEWRETKSNRSSANYNFKQTQKKKAPLKGNKSSQRPEKLCGKDGEQRRRGKTMDT